MYYKVFVSAFCVFFLFIAFSITSITESFANENNEIDASNHYVIALIISSRSGAVSKTVEAIQYFSKQEIKKINSSGGINGRRVKLVVLDDKENVNTTVKLVENVLKRKNLIAIVGLWSSTRGSKVVEQIGRAGVPFISEMSLTNLFEQYQNIFTMIRSEVDETELFKKFIKENHKSIVFYGLKGDLFTEKFLSATESLQPSVELTNKYWISDLKADNSETINNLITHIKEFKPAVLCLSAGSNGGAEVIKKLENEGIKIPVFIASGSVLRIQRNMAGKVYSGSLFQVSNSIPFVDNERLAQLKRRPDFQKLLKEYEDDDIGYGISYADILAMIHQSSSSKEKLENTQELREKITKKLNIYQEGQRFFRGKWRDWAFTKQRSIYENTLIIYKDPGHQELRLWPLQFRRIKGELKPVPVLYTGVDMVRIFAINTNTKTFDAEFYFSIAGQENIGIEDVEFTNAVRGEEERQLIAIRKILDGSAHTGNDPSLKVYKVNGRFLFEPNLKNYPFDQQQFSVSLQPKNMSSPFIIQPSNKALRDRSFNVLGWKLVDSDTAEYVGFDQDIISTLQNQAQDRKILPLNKFNFTWILERQALDYYLRVVIPLCLIMLVAYFSIFIPNARVDTIVGIQVTTLLSVIALYFSIPKLDTDTATLSDEIFVFSEMVIVMLVCMSIMRVHSAVKEAPIFGWVLSLAQLVLFPIMTVLMIRYLSLSSKDHLFSSKPYGEILKTLVWLN